MKIPAAGSAILALLAACVSLSAADRPFTLSLGGGLHPVFTVGEAGNYQAGINDFPVTPSHSPAWAGLSLGWSPGRWLFELEARWIAPSAVVLEDPFDGDTLALDTSARLGVTLGIFYRLSMGRLQPYLGAAAGLDAILAGEVQATSRYGYTIVLPAPSFQDRFDPLLTAGGGVLVRITRWLGARLDARYVWVLEKSEPMRGVQAGGGLMLSF